VSRAIDGASFALQSQRHLLAGAVFANTLNRQGQTRWRSSAARLQDAKKPGRLRPRAWRMP
jgi:hypothetical protein